MQQSNTNHKGVTLMKRTLMATLFGAAVILGQPASGQSWQTVDDFNLYPGFDSSAQAMGRDPFGNIYTAGSAVIDTNYDYVAAIRKSSDGGATWNTIDLFSQGEAAPSYEYTAITSDSAGNLCAAGNAGWPHTWFTRQSVDGGITWSTVDTVAATPGNHAYAWGAAADSAGNIYVVGNVYRSWVVRKAISGSAWSTVDSFNPGSSGSAKAVVCHPAGVFVLGTGYLNVKNSSAPYWYVRRSQNDGATWSTVDTYAGDFANAIGTDATGNIYTVGRSAGHWIVRKSGNGGTSWATIDDFKLPCTTLSVKPARSQCYSARAVGFAADPLGNLFVAGVTESPTGYHWIVRESVGGTGAWQTVDDFQYVAGKEEWPYGIVADYAGHVFVGGFGTDNSAAYGGYGAYHWLVRRN
jgi:hypothetical protein